MRRYLENTRAPNTLKAYATDCRYFVAWCKENGLDPLPAEPETVPSTSATWPGSAPSRPCCGAWRPSA